MRYRIECNNCGQGPWATEGPSLFALVAAFAAHAIRAHSKEFIITSPLIYTEVRDPHWVLLSEEAA